MSSELYEQMVSVMQNDQAIYEAEEEVNEGAEPIALDVARDRLDKKYYG